MKSGYTLNSRQAEYLLASLIIARSTSYLCSKTALAVLGPFTLLSIRYLLAAGLLLPLLAARRQRLRRSAIAGGLLLGVVYFAEMAAETVGLRRTDTSTAALLVNAAIVLVPLMEAVIHRRPPRPAELAGALTTLCGIGLLALRSGGLAWQGGEHLCILAAFSYAVYIILTARLSREEDPVLLGVIQVLLLAVCSPIAAVLTEAPELPDSGSVWGVILWLAVVCTVFGLTLQPVAQRHTSAERTAVFCALNPLASAVMGYVLLNEHFGPLGLLGAALILAGILLCNHHPHTSYSNLND